MPKVFLISILFYPMRGIYMYSHHGWYNIWFAVVFVAVVVSMRIFDSYSHTDITANNNNKKEKIFIEFSPIILNWFYRCNWIFVGFCDEESTGVCPITDYTSISLIRLRYIKDIMSHSSDCIAARKCNDQTNLHKTRQTRRTSNLDSRPNLLCALIRDWRLELPSEALFRKFKDWPEFISGDISVH